MANTANGTVWNLPNYTGELFTSDVINTPLLTAIGGLTGGMMTENFEFATDSQYNHEAASQPAITETASLTAPTAVSYVRAQSKNVTQIFQEKVSISYVKMSNQGRLSGINSAGAVNNVPTERDFQIARALEKIARDVEYTFINGTYALSNGVGVANKTRGLLELCTVNTVDANAVALSKTLIDTLLLEMFTNGATFKNLAIFCNGLQKQRLSDIYGYAPMDRNIGGLNIKQIETEFGNIAVMPAHKFVPTAQMLFAEMSVLAPVFQPVPTKGNLFYEELAKTGAAEEGMVFGQIGLNHGCSYMHGTLTNLAIV